MQGSTAQGVKQVKSASQLHVDMRLLLGLTPTPKIPEMPPLTMPVAAQPSISIGECSPRGRTSVLPLPGSSLQSLASRSAANARKKHPRMCLSRTGEWMSTCRRKSNPPTKLHRLHTPNTRQTGRSIDEDWQLRHVRKTDVGKAIATSSTCVCSKGTVPGSSSRLATCQPRTIMMPEPNPQIPFPTFAARAPATAPEGNHDISRAPLATRADEITKRLYSHCRGIGS